MLFFFVASCAPKLNGSRATGWPNVMVYIYWWGSPAGVFCHIEEKKPEMVASLFIFDFFGAVSRTVIVV